MIRINLLPVAHRPSRGVKLGPSAWVGIYGAVFLVTVALLTFLYLSQAAERDDLIARNQEMEREIAMLERQAAGIDQVRALLERSRKLEEVVRQLNRARYGPTRVLLELARILSRDGGPTIDPARFEEIRRNNPLAGYNPNWDHHRLWLTAFEEEERRVQIRGVGRSNEDVAELLKRLSLSELFEEVALMKTEAGQDEATRLDVIRFELVAKVHY
ncbi:MAG: PilN domain-containing protein [Sandaracinaceae bacterium]|nr:PilN domain-containing protein [Sandaracinaceae bacterium]